MDSVIKHHRFYQVSSSNAGEASALVAAQCPDDHVIVSEVAIPIAANVRAVELCETIFAFLQSCLCYSLLINMNDLLRSITL